MKLAVSATAPWLEETLTTMRASRSETAQKAIVPQPGEEGTRASVTCRKAGIRQATECNRRHPSVGLRPDGKRRLTPPETENSRLQKIVADRAARIGPEDQGDLRDAGENNDLKLFTGNAAVNRSREYWREEKACAPFGA